MMLIGRPKRDPAVIRQIKQWAYDNLPISRDAVVSVMELECHESGCPPLETVVAVMEQGNATLQQHPTTTGTVKGNAAAVTSGK